MCMAYVYVRVLAWCNVLVRLHKLLYAAAQTLVCVYVCAIVCVRLHA